MRSRFNVAGVESRKKDKKKRRGGGQKVALKYKRRVTRTQKEKLAVFD